MLKINCLVKCSALALAFVVTATSVTDAQQGGPGRGGSGGSRGGFPGGFPGGGFGGSFPGTPDKVSLLGNPQVQTELKIASEQKLFLDDILAEHREKLGKIFEGFDFRTFRDKPEAEQEKIRAEQQTQREKLNKDAEAGLQEFLSEEQITRLDQIILQIRGLRALIDDQVAEKLAITADQKQRIEDVFTAAGEARQKMFEEMRGNRDGGARDGGNRGGANPDGGNQSGVRRGGRGGFDPAAFAEMQKKMEESGRKTEAEVLAVLTAEQKKKFEDMKGKPFELERRGFGGPGGFGGRPGGGRPEGGRPQGDGGDRPRRPSAE